MSREWWVGRIGAWALLVVGLVIVGLSWAQAAPKAKLQGTVRVSGAWALYPMMVTWAEEFQKVNPGVRIDVSAGGAGKGAADVLGGLVDIGMISRDVHPDEAKRGGWWIPVVKDAVVPVANAANPVARELQTRGLPREFFRTCWVENKSTTWGEVMAKPQVHDPVTVYTRSDSCGAAETWAAYLGGKQDDLKGTAVFGDPGLAEAVRRDRRGLGFNNLNYAYDARTGKPIAGLMVVPIDINGNGKVDANERFYDTRAHVARAIASGVYPSPPARDLNLMTKGKPSGLTRTFLLWIVGDGQKYVDAAGYIQLPKQKLADATKKLK